MKKEYDSVILAVGAYKRGELKLEGGEAQNALAFLEDYNRTNGKMAIGRMWLSSAAAIQRWIQLVQQNAVMVLSMCILFIEEQNSTCLLMNMN